MAFVRSFSGYTPPRRFDSTAFVSARIEESASATSGFSTIDTKTLSPVDADPANPQARNFTTTNAQLEEGWYRIVWVDAAAAEFPSEVVPFPLPEGTRERLERMVAADSEPQLDSSEIDQLLELARVADAQGRAPSDASWMPTFDLNFAAAEGWRWKAAVASSNFNFATDNNRFDRSQVYAQCMAQTGHYAAKGALVLRLRSSTFPVEIFTDQAEVVR